MHTDRSKTSTTKEGKAPHPLSAEGAEAQVSEEDFLGIRALKKRRIPKGYRPDEMDRRIRTERLKTEVRLLKEARRMGVRTPIVLDLSVAASEFIMEKVDGRPVTEIIQDPTSPKELLLEIMEHLGVAIGRLHAAGIAHGDLTASNVIWTGKEVALIDMSMGTRTPELEDKGIDLHLVEEDMNTLTALSAKLNARFLEGYRVGNPSEGETVIKRAHEIKGRVRYS
jgi:Kae1-associated kinase Bud32